MQLPPTAACLRNSVAYLQCDAAVAAAGELMTFLPANFTHRENVELLENIAEHVAPHLGWTPAV